MKIKSKLESLQTFKKSKKKQKSKKADLKKKKKDDDLLENKVEAKKETKAKSVTSETKTTTKTEPPKATPKAELESASSSKVTPTLDLATSRQRVSKNITAPTKAEQAVATNLIIQKILLGEVTQGEALRELRVKVLGLRQEAFIELVGVSRKTLSELENDKGNYTSEITNKVFKPFGLKVGLVPTSSSELKSLLDKA